MDRWTHRQRRGQVFLGSQLGHRAGGLAAMVCRGFRATVGKARVLKLFKSKVLSISAGYSHTVACMQSGVYTFGDGMAGRLGHGGNGNEGMPRVIEALTGKQVVGATAGGNHTVVWTEAGELYTFGAGMDQQLGHGGREHEDFPRVVEALAGKQVAGAAAGFSHTVVWTEAGELYTFGAGGFGRLGHGGQHDEHEDVPRVVAALAGKQVVGAAASAVHTVVWTEAGELYTFGYEEEGQLGHGGQDGENVPRVVEALAGKQVVGAAAGGDHTVVWTEAGELYTFGAGGFGQLGHGGQDDENVPRLVEALTGKQVVGAAAGGAHTVVWTEAGEIFTFGDGEDGQLGHGGDEHEHVPRVVEALARQTIVGASTDVAHTVVWTEAGEVYTFGTDTRGGGRADSEGRCELLIRRMCM